MSSFFRNQADIVNLVLLEITLSPVLDLSIRSVQHRLLLLLSLLLLLNHSPDSVVPMKGCHTAVHNMLTPLQHLFPFCLPDHSTIITNSTFDAK